MNITLVNKHLLSFSQAAGVGNSKSTESCFFPLRKSLLRGTGGTAGKGRLGQVGRVSFEELCYGNLQTAPGPKKKTVGDFWLFPVGE